MKLMLSQNTCSIKLLTPLNYQLCTYLFCRSRRLCIKHLLLNLYIRLVLHTAADKERMPKLIVTAYVFVLLCEIGFPPGILTAKWPTCYGLKVTEHYTPSDKHLSVGPMGIDWEAVRLKGFFILITH